VIALPQRQQVPAQLAQPLRLAGGIIPAGSRLSQRHGDARRQANGQLIGRLAAGHLSV
jgi:hypothetical protein